MSTSLGRNRAQGKTGEAPTDASLVRDPLVTRWTAEMRARADIERKVWDALKRPEK